MNSPMPGALLGFAFLAVGCGSEAPDASGAAPDAPEAATSVVINEVDVFGRDWVELANSSEKAVDLSGWTLSDDPERGSHRYLLPAGSVVEAGGRLVIKGEDEKGDGKGFPFGLKAGDALVLLSLDGAEARRCEVGEVPPDHTWGRHPDMVGDFRVTAPTQGRVNDIPRDLDVELFNPEVILRIEIAFDEAAAISLGENPYSYVPGAVRILSAGEELAEGDAGVRLKGGLSFRPLTGKASFKLRFDEYDDTHRLLGLQRLTLNAMVDDPTMMRETLAYRFFREHGVPAARTGYAQVFVNGLEYGLYLVLEPYDDVAMAARFSSTGHVYEGSVDLFRGQGPQLDVDEGDAQDRGDVEALIDFVHGADDATWVETVDAVLDLEVFLRLWAVEAAIGHWDGYVYAGNNYYLHSDRSGRFTLLPSGLDRTFERTLDPEAATSVVAARCAAIDACQARYAAERARVDGAASGLRPFGQALRDRLRPAADADPRAPATAAARSLAVDELLDFVGAL